MIGTLLPTGVLSEEKGGLLSEQPLQVENGIFKKLLETLKKARP